MSNAWKYILAALTALGAILATVFLMRRKQPAAVDVSPVSSEAARQYQKRSEELQAVAKMAEVNRLDQEKSVAKALAGNHNLHAEIEAAETMEELQEIMRRGGW
jgi:hypothetical protein